MLELAITHRDACFISSLRVRGILVIRHDGDFPINRMLWKTLRDDASFERKESS